MYLVSFVTKQTLRRIRRQIVLQNDTLYQKLGRSSQKPTQIRNHSSPSLAHCTLLRNIAVHLPLTPRNPVHSSRSPQIKHETPRKPHYNKSKVLTGIGEEAKFWRRHGAMRSTQLQATDEVGHHSASVAASATWVPASPS